jgi:endoglucanase
LARIEALMRVPTAPFREDWMCAALDAMLAEMPGVETQVDRFGNRIARVRRGAPQGPPLVFVSHLDHPGFLFPLPGGAVPIAPRRYEARFEGRVDDSFFAGAAVRLFRGPDDPGVPGTIVDAGEVDASTDTRIIRIEAQEDADGAVLAMWDVPVFSVSDGVVRARACDDLAGCGVLVDALSRAVRMDDVNLGVIFSRAEEAGFCGVLCMLAEPSLPVLVDPEAVFVSVEISSERPGVVLGDGAVIRVGDRSSTFDGFFADMLWTITRRAELRARRALMDGGTCEATAFARAGLRAAGICAPVRNYHNQDRQAGMIAPEMVAVDDIMALGSLVEGVARAYAAGQRPEPPHYLNFDLFLAKGIKNLPNEEPAPFVGKGRGPDATGTV